MRHSGLSLAVVLLLSSITTAQHTGSTPATQSSMAAAPPPSSPTTFSTSPATSPASGSMVSHGSPSPSVTTPVIPITPSQGATPAHVFSGTPIETSSGRTGTTARIPASEPGRILPDEKISGEHKIVSAPRVGENLPETKTVARPSSDLRRRVCAEVGCKDAAKKPEPDLRRPVCLNGPCPCQPGQSPGKNGCTAPTVATANQCWPGEFWNGASCVGSSAACASVTASAATFVNELLGLKAQVQDACSQDPRGQDCDDLKLRQRGLLAGYEMVFNGADLSCRGTLLDPASLI